MLWADFNKVAENDRLRECIVEAKANGGVPQGDYDALSLEAERLRTRVTDLENELASYRLAERRERAADRASDVY